MTFPPISNNKKTSSPTIRSKENTNHYHYSNIAKLHSNNMLFSTTHFLLLVAFVCGQTTTTSPTIGPTTAGTAMPTLGPTVATGGSGGSTTEPTLTAGNTDAPSGPTAGKTDKPTKTPKSKMPTTATSCQRRGQNCSIGAQCCKGPLKEHCVGVGGAIIKKCGKCGGLGDRCASTTDCCRGVSATRCSKDRICERCMNEEQTCDTANDCCPGLNCKRVEKGSDKKVCYRNT
jgi:hypothetical protein